MTKGERSSHYQNGDTLLSTQTRADGTKRVYAFKCISTGDDETALWTPLGRVMTRAEVNAELGIVHAPAERTYD